MGISINVIAGNDKESSIVNASGTVQHVITDEEVTTFNLKDQQLKEAVAAYFGKSPNDAYLRSPTKWGDLYDTYDWPQVEMHLVVQSAEVLGITSKPVIVKSQEFVNNSNNKATFNVAISESVENSASSSWSKSNTISVEEKIKCGISFLGTGGGSETSMSFSHSWGTGGGTSQSITLGSSSGVSVELNPGEAVLAKLSASRGVMKIRIRYNAFLNGSAAVNYNPVFNGHHFWGLNIGSVMSKAGFSNSVITTEDIEIGYYSHSSITLIDPTTKALKATYMLADTPGH